MSALVSRLRRDEGQAIVLVVAILLVLIGVSALVIDGGHWFHAQRHLQTAADAAALAGAQNLPSSPANATTVASAYAADNYAGATAAITIPPNPNPQPTLCVSSPANCIRVVTSIPVPGTLSKIYSEIRNTTPVKTARATAAVTIPSLFKNLAPVAIKNTVACTTASCYGQTKTVSFDESNVASSTIGLIDLTCHSTASTACPSNAGVGASELKAWIETGYADALPANQWYGVKTGQSVGPIKQGFTDRLGVRLFFPVFDTTANAGPVWYFHIIGWAAFVVDSVDSWTPSQKRLTGHFVTFTTSDLPAGTPPTGGIDFGVHILTLVE